MKFNKKIRIEILEAYAAKAVKNATPKLTKAADAVDAFVMELHEKHVTPLINKYTELALVADVPDLYNRSKVVMTMPKLPDATHSGESYFAFELMSRGSLRILPYIKDNTRCVPWLNKSNTLQLPCFLVSGTSNRSEIKIATRCTKKQIKEYKKLEEVLDTQVGDLRRACEVVWNLLVTCSTEKKLLQVIPEMEQFLPKDLSSTGLMVIPTSVVTAITP